MSENFILYSKKYNSLPVIQMRALVKHLLPQESSGEYGRVFSYEWDDIKIMCTELSNDQIEKQKNDFSGYIRMIGANYPFQAFYLIKKIDKTTLVVCVDIIPKRDPQGRAEDLIGKLCYGLKPIIYFDGAIFDHKSNIILAPEGVF